VNSGVYTLHLRKYARWVIAIEPNHKYTRFIESALPDVQVVAAALSDHRGRIVLKVPYHDDGLATVEASNLLADAAYECLVVPVVSIDSLNLPRVGFIKLDVEGHELAVIHGATATIARDLPAMIVEAEERHRRRRSAPSTRPCSRKVTRVSSYIAAGSTRLRHLTRRGVRPSARWRRSACTVSRVYYTWACSRDNAEGGYVHDFVFVHASQRDRIARCLSV
jgi:FkbM family methyltransferase